MLLWLGSSFCRRAPWWISAVLNILISTIVETLNILVLAFLTHLMIFDMSLRSFFALPFRIIPIAFYKCFSLFNKLFWRLFRIFTIFSLRLRVFRLSLALGNLKPAFRHKKVHIVTKSLEIREAACLTLKLMTRAKLIIEIGLVFWKAFIIK